MRHLNTHLKSRLSDPEITDTQVCLQNRSSRQFNTGKDVQIANDRAEGRREATSPVSTSKTQAVKDDIGDESRDLSDAQVSSEEEERRGTQRGEKR